jgi:hypothetical protein
MRIFELLLKNEYDLGNLKHYSEPKIYTANGDISKRWYVYFSYRNPETGKLKRQPPIYKEANKLKNKTARLEYLTTIKVVLSSMLKKGYSPYEDAEATDKRLESQKKKRKPSIAKKEQVASQRKQYTVKETLEFALSQRKPSWKKKTASTLTGHYKKFMKWLEENKLLDNDIKDLKKRDISLFLNTIKKAQTKKEILQGKELETISQKTRNNFRATLSLLFAQLEDDEIIDNNFIAKIRQVKSTPKKNKPFSKEQIIDIRNYLDKNDPYLRTFIQFMSWKIRF